MDYRLLGRSGLKVSSLSIGTVTFGNDGSWGETELKDAQRQIDLCLDRGINLIDMHQFPHASVSPIHVPDPIWWELEARLVLVFVGRPHSSSEVHKLVIKELEGAGPDAPKLAPTVGRSWMKPTLNAERAWSLKRRSPMKSSTFDLTQA